jgi:hypothetical protein
VLANLLEIVGTGVGTGVGAGTGIMVGRGVGLCEFDGSIVGS